MNKKLVGTLLLLCCALPAYADSVTVAVKPAKDTRPFSVKHPRWYKTGKVAWTAANLANTALGISSGIRLTFFKI